MATAIAGVGGAEAAIGEGGAGKSDRVQGASLSRAWSQGLSITEKLSMT